MLALAEAKGIYHTHLVHDLHTRSVFEDDHFDAVVSVGVFNVGHVTERALEDLVRITRPGGVILLTVLVDFYRRCWSTG